MKVSAFGFTQHLFPSKKGAGFTLIELLVVVAIIGILAAVGLGQFHTAQKRGRDAQRKENLSSITKALEMYYNDYERYPNIASLVWGEELKDAEETVYMKQLPKDPADNFQYYYETDADGSYYKLYALLEHSEDIDKGGPYVSADDCQKAAGNQDCNYCIASPNEKCE